VVCPLPSRHLHALFIPPRLHSRGVHTNLTCPYSASPFPTPVGVYGALCTMVGYLSSSPRPCFLNLDLVGSRDIVGHHTLGS
jgi:hypothetical protein